MMVKMTKRAIRIGKRVLAQMAMSATVMTGLHFASVSEFPPAVWVFGPMNAGAGSPSAATETASLGATPPVRVIAPSSVAGPPMPVMEAATTAMGQNLPKSAEGEHRVAMLTDEASCSDSCGRAIPRVVAHPTPRPAMPRSVAGATPAEAAESARMVATRPLAQEETAPDPLDADPVPFPPGPPAEAGFVLADMIPGRHVVMRGVSYIGNHALGVVNGAASGALDLVRP